MEADDYQPARWYQESDTTRQNPVAGLYRVAEETGDPEAFVHGTWSDKPAMADQFEERPIEILHGDAYGTPVTLVGCRPVKWSTTMGDWRKTQLSPSLAVEGAYLASDELCFTDVHVKFWDQDIWTEWSTYGADISRTEKSFGFEVRYERPDDMTADLSGARLTLSDASSFRGTSAPRGWTHDSSLGQYEYRLHSKGTRVWLGERKKRDKVSRKTARLVLDRDDSRCVVCGVGAGEECPGEPGSKAKMTIGHRIPGARLGGADPDNLRTECSRCNEPVRDQMPDPETYEEVATEVRTLAKQDAEKLRSWLLRGERSRSKLDHAHGRARRLSPTEQTRLIEELSRRLGS